MTATLAATAWTAQAVDLAATDPVLLAVALLDGDDTVRDALWAACGERGDTWSDALVHAQQIRRERAVLDRMSPRPPTGRLVRTTAPAGGVQTPAPFARRHVTAVPGGCDGDQTTLRRSGPHPILDTALLAVTIPVGAAALTVSALILIRTVTTVLGAVL